MQLLFHLSKNLIHALDSAYKLFDIYANTFFTSQDVIFHESIFPFCQQSQTQFSPPLQGILPTIDIDLPTLVQHSLDQPSSPTRHNALEPPSNQPFSPTRHNAPEPPSNQPSSPTHHNAPKPPSNQHFSPTRHNAPEPSSNQPSFPTHHNAPEPPPNQPSSPTRHNTPKPPGDQPSSPMPRSLAPITKPSPIDLPVRGSSRTSTPPSWLQDYVTGSQANRSTIAQD